MEQPCDGWVPNTALCSTWGDYPAAVRDYAQRFAIYVLWAATGRRFGLCAETVRPCETPNPVLYRTYPVGANGVEPYTLSTAPGGGVVLGYLGGAPCAGCSAPEIPLPPPAVSVTSVTVDGVALDPAAYRLDQDKLVRMDGEGWPTQNLALPIGDPGTWSVTYVRGVPVPAVLNDAAGRYACEVAKSNAGGNCQLPSRIASISRQGVDVQFVAAEDYLDKGRTGYAEVDQLIAAFNPYGLTSRPRVRTLDAPTYR
jgi:hypothetical protein